MAELGHLFPPAATLYMWDRFTQPRPLDTSRPLKHLLAISPHATRQKDATSSPGCAPTSGPKAAVSRRCVGRAMPAVTSSCRTDATILLDEGRVSGLCDARPPWVRR